MNRTTQNDLSYNRVELDYNALRKTALIATRGCVDNIDRHLRAIRNCTSQDTTSLHLNAQWLADEAKALAIVADTLAALNGMLDREEVVIVNKPEVTNEQ